MTRHEAFLQKLAAIAREYEEPLRGQEYLLSRLRWEDWGRWRREGIVWAQEELRRRRWRGRWGGVLPGGGDAEDIVDQAIGEILEGKSRLVIGFTWQKVSAELKRLVSRQIRVLHARAETAALRNEAELGEQELRAVEEMVDGREVGVEGGVEREQEEERINLVEAQLEGESELLALFRCLREGLRSPASLGLKLGMTEGEVAKARKRLVRRLEKLKLRLAQSA